MRENWKAICEARLAMLNEYAVSGQYVLWNESGVKRVYYQAAGQSGMRTFGGGCVSWAELASFLDGVRETLFAIQYGDIAAPAEYDPDREEVAS